MSEATSVTAHALYSHTGSGYDMSNICVLRWDLKTATECAELTCSGRLFHTRAAATGKARSPTVDSRVRLTNYTLSSLHNVVCFT